MVGPCIIVEVDLLDRSEDADLNLNDRLRVCFRRLHITHALIARVDPDGKRFIVHGL